MKTLMTVLVCLALLMTVIVPSLATSEVVKVYNIVPVIAIEVNGGDIQLEEEVTIPVEYLAGKLRSASLATGRFIVTVSGGKFSSVANSQDRIQNSGRYRQDSRKIVRTGKMVAPSDQFGLTAISTVSYDNKSFDIDATNRNSGFGSGGRDLGGALDGHRGGGLSSVGGGTRDLGGVLDGSRGGLSRPSNFNTNRLGGGRSSSRRGNGTGFDLTKSEVGIHLILEPANIESGLVDQTFEGEGKARISDLGVNLSIAGVSVTHSSSQDRSLALVKKAVDLAVAEVVDQMVENYSESEPVGQMTVTSGKRIISGRSSIIFERNGKKIARYEVLGVKGNNLLVRALSGSDYRQVDGDLMKIVNQ